MWVVLHPGDSVRLQLVLARGSRVGADPATLGWTSSHPDVADVSAQGVVTAVAYGTTTITADMAAAEARATVVIAPPVLIGAGDIGHCRGAGDDSTAHLLDTIPGVIFTTGDHAYPSGSAADFANCYDPIWGRHRARTRPSPGNHDYRTPGASAYFEYFGAQAGSSGTGYYSWDFAGWHLVSLNSNIDVSEGSPQQRWLRDDLAAHPARCTLAYWHRPRFSSGREGDWIDADGLWRVLYDMGADVVVGGHDHIYERFAPQTPDAAADSARGIREFVVGTGGRSHYEIVGARPNSEVSDNTTDGVLLLSLRPAGYEWRFVAAGGGVFSDRGAGVCH